MSKSQRILKAIAIGLALFFGIVTVFKGGSVAFFAGDPGYIVYRPLVLYNFSMGFLYITAGLLLWKSLRSGQILASSIFVLNLIALIAIIAIFKHGGGVAKQSLAAMSFRSMLWFTIALIAFKLPQEEKT